MLPQNSERASRPPMGFSASMPPKDGGGASRAMGAEITSLDSTGDDYLLRRRVQKLRWLGLDREADRLAASLPGRRAASAHVEFPETD
jgi:hypothetical protein